MEIRIRAIDDESLGHQFHFRQCRPEALVPFGVAHRKEP